LEVGERERRVAVEVDLAVQQERLAGRALTFLAAVHQHDALPEGGVEDRLVLVDLELDPHGLEARDVLLTHGDRPGARPAWSSGAQPCAGRPAGPPALYLATWASRSCGDISFNRMLGLLSVMPRTSSSVHIFLGSRSRWGCGISVLPSSRT